MKNLKWWFATIFLGSITLSFLVDLVKGKSVFASLILSLSLTILLLLKALSKTKVNINSEYRVQVASYQYYQPELKSAFFNRQNRQNVLIQEGVELIPEPTNKHDKNAIKVILDGVQIGYIPSDQTNIVRKKLKQKALLRVYEYDDYTRCELILK